MKSSSSSTEKVKQLKGDGLRIEMETNDLNLRVSGDGCRVTVERNCGLIRVVGDGCSLTVNCNDGKIEYKGDGGSITLGGGSRLTESVSYVGDGGRIIVRSADCEGKIVDDLSGRRLKRSTVENKKKGKKTFCTSVSDSELENMDNAANEMKEARENRESRLDNDNNRTERRKNRLVRSKTVVVTRISSEQIPVNINNNNNNNNNFVKNWFKCSPTITRSFKSHSHQPESI